MFNALITFSIGFVAGVAPWLLSYMIPVLADPSKDLVNFNCLIMAGTGVLVGLVTAICFSKEYPKRKPADIFFYAVGIPALLVGNVSTFQAINTINRARVVYSDEVIKPSAIDKYDGAEVIPANPHRRSSFLSPKTAWAREGEIKLVARVVPSNTYIVSVGEFRTLREAQEKYNDLKNKTLNIERYERQYKCAKKNLKIYKLKNNLYVVGYTQTNSLDDARKVYKLLRINDPRLDSRIIEIN